MQSPLTSRISLSIDGVRIPEVLNWRAANAVPNTNPVTAMDTRRSRVGDVGNQIWFDLNFSIPLRYIPEGSQEVDYWAYSIQQPIIIIATRGVQGSLTSSGNDIIYKGYQEIYNNCRFVGADEEFSGVGNVAMKHYTFRADIPQITSRN